MKGANPIEQLHFTRTRRKLKVLPLSRGNYERRQFATSAERNEFAAAMKAIKDGVVKYSTVSGNRSIFVCAWPIRSAE